MDELRIWEALLRNLTAEGSETFLLERVTAQSLRNAYESGNGVIVQDESTGEIIACAFVWDTADASVAELGTLFVVKEHRGNGLSSDIYHLRLELLAAQCRLLFIISHEPHVAHLATKHGFIEQCASEWGTLVHPKHTCGPCTRVSGDTKLRCPFRAVGTQCRLFVLDRR